MANSVEYRTIAQCTDKLKDALKDDLDTLSGELLAEGLIGDDSEVALRNSSVTASSRAADLVQLVRNKVKIDPENYQVFIQALTKRRDDHLSILKILNQKYKALVAEKNQALVFSEDMSEDEFVSFLKANGVTDGDCSKLTKNGIGAKVFIDLSDQDFDEPSLNFTFGGKRALKKILGGIKNPLPPSPVPQPHNAEPSPNNATQSPPPPQPGPYKQLKDKDHIKMYMKLAGYAVHWKEIGTGLGFKHTELQLIQSEPMLLIDGPKGYLRKMLSQWLQWAKGDGRGSSDYANTVDLHKALLFCNLACLAQELDTLLHQE